MNPTTIGRNIDRDRTGVSRRLSVLVECNLVNKVDEGYYKITDLGKQYLSGDLDADELEFNE
ncbi:transcriptional regulator [Halostagnicola bangensis]